LSFANPQKGHFMALDFVRSVQPTTLPLHTAAMPEARRNLLSWPINKIVTVEMDAEGQSDVDAVFRQAPAGIGGRAEHKTAPVPPAVRAPVFPHALPVMEGLKPAILTRGRPEWPPPPKDLIKTALPSA
jgi:hypothetical protein